MTDTDIQAQLAELRTTLKKQHTMRLFWLLNGIKARLGDPVVDAVNATVAEGVTAEWQGIAARESGNTIEDLIRLLWEPLRTQGFEFTYEQTDEGFQMHCTACPHAALAQELDAADWMFALTCACDEHIVAGFNPAMGFRRTKTLIEGDDCCDHFYYYKDVDET